MVHPPVPPDIPFSDADFRALASFAREHFGLSLSDSKKPLVHARIQKRLRARSAKDFSQYMRLVQDTEGGDERDALISALTTNVTNFFREAHHFDALRTELAPVLRQKAKRGERIRLWSAGCSTGQEPFSMAMALLEVLPETAARDIRILATDLDRAVVERGATGRFSAQDIAAIPESMRARWLRPVTDIANMSEIAEPIRRIVRFAVLNLVEDWPFEGPFDAIFCRNVAIYFDQHTQQTLWKRMADKLAPGGLLCIGHSERVTGPGLGQLTSVGVTTYRKDRGNRTEPTGRGET
ncbi:protein-glutamate O-methyltransferase CheR [Thalassococcus sp. CAU 1522]|uniref:Chemotaxis protein methyltransferase n=1 Tax=Thalassococcus arenae TaxID=2851652 RepID=A0ABS6N3M4_9RHOB|nr:protein-glutamate O-methyltransferase CheR [Thalassococcus arenae]MBV2358611.1 protein-glutamate O-methyltransferase CheR [Thalassococcus arenae]